jgi:hypothetical protein
VGWYSDKATSVVFTDISLGMLQKAKLRWEEEPRPYEATFVLSDIEALTEVLHPFKKLSLCMCLMYNDCMLRGVRHHKALQGCCILYPQVIGHV